jgi:hypothetical protein
MVSSASSLGRQRLSWGRVSEHKDPLRLPHRSVKKGADRETTARVSRPSIVSILACPGYSSRVFAAFKTKEKTKNEDSSYCSRDHEVVCG